MAATGAVAPLSAQVLGGDGSGHVIMILETEYFPITSYVTPGQTVTFINATSAPHVLRGLNGNWVSEEIPAQGSASVTITSGMETTFISDTNSSLQGIFSFDAAPELVSTN